MDKPKQWGIDGDVVVYRVGFASDKNDNPRAAFVDIIDLVTFDDDGTDENYDADAVL